LRRPGGLVRPPPLLDAIIEEVDGRRIRVGERWLIDFASCNYLGLDLDREVIEAIPAYLTHIHASVIPVLASDGTVFVDSRAHKTIWDGCVAARAHGATVVRYAHDDPEALERALHRHPRAPRLVCMDGVNSMTGNPPQLPALLALARANDALLYVDDAHGFGVVGERDRLETSGYGRRGNGVVRHLGECYDHVVLTGGFSKAYSSLASVLVGLQVNEARGDELRTVLWARTRRILDHLEKLGAFTLNRSGFPIIEVPLADPDDLARAGRFLLEHGIYVTLAFYPGVPREEVGFRIQVTAANTDDEVTELLATLDRLADAVPLRRS
jgi:8-amino-7-oxononanoate synthase